MFVDEELRKIFLNEWIKVVTFKEIKELLEDGRVVKWSIVEQRKN